MRSILCGYGPSCGFVQVYCPLSLDLLLFFFPCDCGFDRCFLLPNFTVSPLLSSFSSLLCLLSCLCAVVFPLFVFQCFRSILSLFCSLTHVSDYTQFIARSEWPLLLSRLHSSLRHCALLTTSPRFISQSYCILYKRV